MILNQEEANAVADSCSRVNKIGGRLHIHIGVKWGYGVSIVEQLNNEISVVTVDNYSADLDTKEVYENIAAFRTAYELD